MEESEWMKENPPFNGPYTTETTIALTEKHYLFKVPKDGTRFVIFQDEKPYLSYFINSETKRIYLDGEYEILFEANTATDEDWKKVVESQRIKIGEASGNAYKNYANSSWFLTATESGHSLLESKGHYLVNPIDGPPKMSKYLDVRDYHENYQKWQSFEDKAGTYLILEK